MKRIYFLFLIGAVVVLAVVLGVALGKGASDETTGDGASRAPEGVEAVDLGLSVKWASCNVGASEPEEYGDYFAWGETVSKEEYSWATYKWNADDAASVHWGGKWRMPTAQEWDELLNQCDWEWTDWNGVSGYQVSSRKNAGKIFLPAAGIWLEDMLHDLGSRGFYWSSSLYDNNPDCASGLHFYTDNRGRHGTFRNDGLSIRPVME